MPICSCQGLGSGHCYEVHVLYGLSRTQFSLLYKSSFYKWVILHDALRPCNMLRIYLVLPVRLDSYWQFNLIIVRNNY